MPADFLSDRERSVYQSIPADWSPADIDQFGGLSPLDRQLIAVQRRDYNRLGFALQLITIRLLNHLPQTWYNQLPASLTAHVAAQLTIDPAVLKTYGEREATRTTHTQTILAYLKRRRWQPLIDTGSLETWLLERAIEHDNERVLLAMACDWLRAEGILRPAIIEMERLVISVAELAHQETYRRLDALLTPALKEALDTLLVVDAQLSLTPHNWLARPPVSPTFSQIRLTLCKRQYLTAVGVEAWQTDNLHPNRRKRLAALARSKTNQALTRLSQAKRHPILIAFCVETYITLTDYVLERVDS